MHYIGVNELKRFCGLPGRYKTVYIALDEPVITLQLRGVTERKTLRVYGSDYDHEPYGVWEVRLQDLLRAAEGSQAIGISSCRAGDGVIEIVRDNLIRKPLNILGKPGRACVLEPLPEIDRERPWFGVQAVTAATALPKFFHSCHPKHWVRVEAAGDRVRFSQEYEGLEHVLSMPRLCGTEKTWFIANTTELLDIFSFCHRGDSVVACGTDAEGPLVVRYTVATSIDYSCRMSHIPVGKKR